jgi:hypothetical protein
MNIDDQIVQCQKDIEALKQNLVALEKEKNTYVPRHGDMGWYYGNKNDPVVWCENHDGKGLMIINHSGVCDGRRATHYASSFIFSGKNVFDMLKGM